ncbi:MAG: sodium:glutamate symporter [Bacillus sp. (in: Bacteria)]|nr:sodium:glutamate symporter [Bacillus sp. (in: firmicutes)]
MSGEVIGLSIIIIGFLLLIGKWIRVKSKILQKIFLPSSVIAGFIALLLGPEALGRILGELGMQPDFLSHGIFTENIINVWSEFPGLLISVIFATLFIGKKIPNIKKIWNIAGPQISYGQTVAWGQYVFGLLLAITILTPIFGISPMAGALIEIGFEGGHGTAAGLADTFEELGFAEGADLAVGLATIGVVTGVIIGIVLINFAVRRSETSVLENPTDIPEEKLSGIVEEKEREPAGKITTSPESIEPLAFHIAIVGIAVLIGQGILEGLIALEEVTWGAWADTEIMTYVPLFPLAMIGGVVVQIFLQKYDTKNLINRNLIQRVQGLALDFLIVAAVATLSLQVLGENFMPFLLLAVVGIGWNLLAFIFLAPRMIPEDWFERGIPNFGQSMGMTAAGLLLVRISDPKQRTTALEGFGYKQLMFEPVVGGGLFTAASVPLIYQFGPVPILILCSVLMLIWASVGLFHFGRK